MKESRLARACHPRKPPRIVLPSEIEATVNLFNHVTLFPASDSDPPISIFDASYKSNIFIRVQREISAERLYGLYLLFHLFVDPMNWTVIFLAFNYIRCTFHSVHRRLSSRYGTLSTRLTGREFIKIHVCEKFVKTSS